MNYYNDNDPNSAATLRELIRRGLIANGIVDDRSILDVEPSDLRGFTQCHFFAGAGVWSYALRLAGFRDDWEVWTGSPPCQPFSTSGLGLGADDARHLSPKFASLVRACRPALLFGEQVASAQVFGPSAKGNRPGFEGTPPWAWVDDLCDRLEAAHYAVGANDVPNAGVGAPHIRQRTYFGAVRLAYLHKDGCKSRDEVRSIRTEHDSEHGSSSVGLGNTDGSRSPAGLPEPLEREGWNTDVLDDGSCGLSGPDKGQSESIRMAHTHDAERRAEAARGDDGRGQDARRTQDTGNSEGRGRDGRPGPVNGFWRNSDWLFCRDEQWRPVEPGTSPLAHGPAARVGRLRLYGNAINPWAAKVYIQAFCEAAGILLTPDTVGFAGVECHI